MVVGRLLVGSRGGMHVAEASHAKACRCPQVKGVACMQPGVRCEVEPLPTTAWHAEAMNCALHAYGCHMQGVEQLGHAIVTLGLSALGCVSTEYTSSGEASTCMQCSQGGSNSSMLQCCSHTCMGVTQCMMQSCREVVVPAKGELKGSMLRPCTSIKY